MFLTGASGSGHQSSLYLSAVAVDTTGNPDLPHLPEPDMTMYTPSIEAGTSSVTRTIALQGPVAWDGSELRG
jgi:hypothetical protein